MIYKSIKQNLSCSWIKCHTICFFNNTCIVQITYTTIETKEAGFLCPNSYSGEKETLYILYIQYGPDLLFQ